jgi:Cu/Ag efflux protein CusF
MRTTRRRGAAAALLVGVLLAACGGGQVNEGDGTGIVRGIDAKGATVTLEHGDVPGLMRAMTMTFSVARPELLTGIAVGETVDFHLVHEDGTYTVTALREKP